MMIADNGKGFDSTKETMGNGLKNMKKRASEIGAQLFIDSIPGTGTTIKFELAFLNDISKRSLGRSKKMLN
jgi:signal transduction histidine kinase